MGDCINPSSSGINRRSTNNEDNIGNNRITYDIKIKNESAFDGSTLTSMITVEPSEGVISDSEIFFTSAQQHICNSLNTAITNLGAIKAVFSIHGSFVENEYKRIDINDTVTINNQENLESCFESARRTISSKLDMLKTETNEEPQLLYLDLHMHKNIVKTNSYLPAPFAMKRHIVNIDSSDQLSFKWAVLAALHPKIYPNPHILDKFSNELNLDMIEHPVKLNDIPEIERRNNMSFNIFVLKYNFSKKKNDIEGPVYHTKLRRPTHVNLLLLQDESRIHYCYIRQLNQIVDSVNNGQICDGCLCFFENVEHLTRHQQYDCLRVKTVMPVEAEKIIKFVDDKQNQKLPIVVYADFEALLIPIVNETSQTINENNQQAFKRNVSKHKPYSFAYYVKCNDESISVGPITNNDQECETKFVQMLKSTLDDIVTSLPNLVIDFVPVFFHNFTGYDAHFLIKGISSISGDVNGLGDKYNFISIVKKITLRNNRKITLRFLDSMKFLKGSIKTLADNLSREEFRESRRYWKNVDEETFSILIKKGAFPYNYITSMERLYETSLPSKENFYDDLNACHVSDDDYKQALKIWDIFQCRNILEYSMVYLKTDVLLLADLFENLRRTCLNAYKLDPARYNSMSAVSWDAMLKLTQVELELLTDVTMQAFLKKGMRGGYAHCCQRYAKANNRFLDSYDSNEKDNYIMYYDANNLYGWAMSQPLPYGGFEWTDVSEDFKIPADSEVGYYLEVDLEYPNSKIIHDDHADFPFCPEKKICATGDERLITDLTSKKNYVVHYSYLNECLENGLLLRKVHRVLKFKQKPWLKPYVDFNTEQRAVATSTTEKDFYKLMNNSIYGKAITNVENYSGVKIFQHWFMKGSKRGGFHATARPEYHSHAITSDNSITVQYNKTKHVFKFPVYVGYSTLDLAKTHMYKFHYKFMKNKFGENLKLLYTDTDSFVYQIFTKDYYSEIKDHLEDYFDTSNYEVGNQFEYAQFNKMRVGYFKDEFKGSVVKEFVALRPKVYMIDAEGDSVKRASSAPHVVRDQFEIEDYKKCLFEQEKLYKEMHIIKAVGHDLYTQHVRKAVLSPNADSKRHWLENKIDSLPFGHYKII